MTVTRESHEEKPDLDPLKRPWYHTIELGDGRVTPGIFDHKPLR